MQTAANCRDLDAHLPAHTMQANDGAMTSNLSPAAAHALKRSLRLLDQALMDNRPALRTGDDRPADLDAACRSLRLGLTGLVESLAALAAGPACRGESLVAEVDHAVANLIATYCNAARLAQLAGRAPVHECWADQCRDVLVLLAEAFARLIEHAAHGIGRIEIDLSFNVPDSEHDLADFRPARLAYAHDATMSALTTVLPEPMPDRQPASSRDADTEARNLAWGMFGLVALGAWLGSWFGHGDD